MAKQFVKGILLKSRLDFLERNFGADAIERLLPHLKGEAKELFSDTKKIRATSWYDFEINKELDETIRRVLVKGDAGVFWRMGAFTNEFQTVSSSRHAYHDPWKYLAVHISVLPRFWKPGRAELIRVDDGEAIIRIHDLRSTRHYCLTNLGFFHTGLEMAGATEVEVVETQCTEDPKVQYCEYRLRFKWYPE
jgi:hypothetical protein